MAAPENYQLQFIRSNRALEKKVLFEYSLRELLTLLMPKN